MTAAVRFTSDRRTANPIADTLSDSASASPPLANNLTFYPLIPPTSL